MRNPGPFECASPALLHAHLHLNDPQQMKALFVLSADLGEQTSKLIKIPDVDMYNILRFVEQDPATRTDRRRLVSEMVERGAMAREFNNTLEASWKRYQGSLRLRALLDDGSAARLAGMADIDPHALADYIAENPQRRAALVPDALREGDIGQRLKLARLQSVERLEDLYGDKSPTTAALFEAEKSGAGLTDIVGWIDDKKSDPTAHAQRAALIQTLVAGRAGAQTFALKSTLDWLEKVATYFPPDSASWKKAVSISKHSIITDIKPLEAAADNPEQLKESIAEHLEFVDRLLSEGVPASYLTANYAVITLLDHAMQSERGGTRVRTQSRDHLVELAKQGANFQVLKSTLDRLASGSPDHEAYLLTAISLIKWDGSAKQLSNSKLLTILAAMARSGSHSSQTMKIIVDGKIHDISREATRWHHYLLNPDITNDGKKIFQRAFSATDREAVYRYRRSSSDVDFSNHVLNLAIMNRLLGDTAPIFPERLEAVVKLDRLVGWDPDIMRRVFELEARGILDIQSFWDDGVRPGLREIEELEKNNTINTDYERLVSRFFGPEGKKQFVICGLDLFSQLRALADNGQDLKALSQWLNASSDAGMGRSILVQALLAVQAPPELLTPSCLARLERILNHQGAELGTTAVGEIINASRQAPDRINEILAVFDPAEN